MAGWAEREINLSLELSRMQSHLIAVMGQIVRGTMLLSPDGRITWANASMEKLLGFESGAMNGIAQEQAMAGDTVHDIREILAKGDEGESGDIKAMFRHKDGRILGLSATLVSSTVDGQRYSTLLVKRA